MSVLAFSLPSAVLVQGLILGLNYGLLAVGLVLVYRTSRVLNFAQGEMGVVAAVFLAKLVEDYGVPYWLALIISLAVGAGVGAVTEVVLRRLYARPRLIVMLATIGISQILFVVTLLGIFRPDHLFTAYPVPFGSGFRVGGELFGGGDKFALIAAPLAAAGFAVFFLRSHYGLAMRAVAENRDSARIAGLRARRVSTMAWMLAGLLSAVTAILAAPDQGNGFSQALGPQLLLRALAAALLAAMTSLPIAFGAGIVLGLVESALLWNLHLSSTVEVVMFVVLLAALFARVRALQKGPRDEERSSWAFGAAVGRVVQSARRETVRRASLVSALALALILPAFLDNSRTFLFARIFVFAVIGLSLTVLTGWGGQLSLGHFAFVAVGAVVTSRLAGHVPLPLVFLYAALIAAALAVAVGIPALRVRGLYLAVTTLGLALLMQVAVLNTPCVQLPLVHWHVCSGLPDPASTLVARPRFLGMNLSGQAATYYLVLAVLIICLWMARTWRDRGVARDLVAVRDNETGAAAAGVRVTRTKLTAFALSGGMAGVAGVCFALVTQRFQATTFDPSQSILVVAMVIIGGLGSIEGAVLGALYLIGVPAIFGSGTTVQFVTSGVGLTLFILFLPGGLASLLHRIGDAVTALRWSDLRSGSWWMSPPATSPAAQLTPSTAAPTPSVPSVREAS